MCLGALGLGLVDAAIGYAVPGLLPHLFTASPAVRAEIARTAPLIGAVLFVHAISVSLEGVLFATGDARSVAKIYGGNAALVAVAFAAIRRSGPTLAKVWGGFFCYNLLRCAQFVAKLCWNQRVVDRKRDLAPWLLNYSRGKRPKPTTTTDIAPVVWTSSYDARKYSNIDYTV